jgi:hypothetical protein
MPLRIKKMIKRTIFGSRNGVSPDGNKSKKRAAVSGKSGFVDGIKIQWDDSVLNKSESSLDLGQLNSIPEESLEEYPPGAADESLDGSLTDSVAESLDDSARRE